MVSIKYGGGKVERAREKMEEWKKMIKLAELAVDKITESIMGQGTVIIS